MSQNDESGFTTGESDLEQSVDATAAELLETETAADVENVIDVDDVDAVASALTELLSEIHFGGDEDRNEAIANAAVRVAAFIPDDASDEHESLVDDTCKWATVTGAYENASEVRDELAKTRSSVGRSATFSVNKIVKEWPINTEDEEIIWRFHVSARGENATIALESTELNTPRLFETKVFELTNQRVSFDEWDDQLQYWVDTSPVENVEKDPLSNEHALAEDVIRYLGSLDIVDDMDYFKANSKRCVYYDASRDTVIVASKLLNTVKNKNGHTDVNMRKLRSILKKFVTSSQSKQIRILDDNFMTVWHFDPELLAASIGVDDIAEEAERWEPNEYDYSEDY